MAVFKSPGVFVKEVDISIVRPFSKRYLRRKKIRKILGLSDISDVIITSTPKGGPTNFPQIY